ncbi:hypothetical protein EGH24_00625 [Halonotius terrestris]|uniref:Uncharacterized protein n=1 Tax=Halonotius terrestris TaxID=2487750 RepID=A0A8J8PDI7_9EURY|nr:hypothetical protein [Halonotius terrestris]TQQ83340.1 hypothetical protein EGH24_00625 [Halonotius terrestris]
MDSAVSERTLADHQRVFDRIWRQYPDRQNRSSSSWWWFILFPEGEDGYGPQQLMFSIAARAGDRIRVNGIPMTGFDLDRDTSAGVDTFNAISVGWYGDDETVHEGLVNQPATATLSRDGSIEAWTETNDGRRGSEIRAATDRPLGLEATFVGDNGRADFEAWGDLENSVDSPVQAIDDWSTDLVAWRRMQFEGEFDLPSGTERLSGLCYFQRVCLNVPLFPWKWVWAFFPDGTAFSAFVPFLGPQLLRRGYRFFDSTRLERLTVPIRQSGLWESATGDRIVEFDSATIEPVFSGGDHPDFEVSVSDGAGNRVAFDAASYGHARNYIDRPLLGGALDSHWSYNEYLFRTTNLRGRIDGDPITTATTGQGFGTLEYACGLGL